MVCPNCKAEFEGAHCPNCGRPVSRKGNRAAALVVLVVCVLPLAATGTCCVVTGVGFDPAASGAPLGPISLSVGVVALVLCAAAISWFIKLWKDP